VGVTDFGNFSTGSFNLPDTGELTYNGVRFSSLFHSRLQGVAVKDAAGRTVKVVEWRLMAEGIVTLYTTGNTNTPNQTSIDSTLSIMRQKLDQQGGTLIYKGRGFGDLTVNAPGGTGLRDVAWGPTPETFDFTPLGNGLSAAVVWGCTVRIAEYKTLKPENRGLTNLEGIKDFAVEGQILQFNEEISISYKSDGYSTFSVNGTLEVAQTRKTVDDRGVDTRFLESQRQRLMGLIGSRIDLTRFYLPTRNFHFSRDRRTMEWDFSADEQAPMGNPTWATQARGNFNIRPVKEGVAIIRWICSMRCTYVIRKDFDRYNAWRAFLMLYIARKSATQLGHLANAFKKDRANQGNDPNKAVDFLRGALAPVLPLAPSPLSPNLLWGSFFGENKNAAQDKKVNDQETAISWPTYWGTDEGLYMDSKTVTFEVHWLLSTTPSTVLIASGFLRTSKNEKKDVWAASMRDICGGSSWLKNNIGNAEGDVIVDFGGGSP
jgi:hypothetical protein